MCADEAVDASTKEQLPPILRFIDINGQVREQFIEFIVCDTGTSWEAIAQNHRCDGKTLLRPIIPSWSVLRWGW